MNEWVGSKAREVVDGRARPALWLILRLSHLPSQSLKGKGLRDCSAIPNYHILFLTFSMLLFICALQLSLAHCSVLFLIHFLTTIIIIDIIIL